MATFMANPYAPRNEWLSLMMKAPGSLSFRTATAVRAQLKLKPPCFARGLKRHIYQVPWSLEMSGLYQNFEVSCTNFPASVLLARSTGERKCLMFC